MSQSSVKDDLICKHLPLLRKLAAVMARRLKGVEFDDILAMGTLGLMDAADRFDPSRGIAFATMAHHRILGAIMDGIREMDWVPRLVRARTRLASRLRDEFFKDHGRAPESDELEPLIRREIQEGRFSASCYTRANMNMRRRGDIPEAIVRKTANGDGRYARMKQVDGTARFVALPTRLEGSIREYLAMIHTDRAERLMMLCMYESDCTMEEAGKAIGVSQSRISQMHASVIHRLRAALSKAA